MVEKKHLPGPQLDLDLSVQASCDYPLCCLSPIPQPFVELAHPVGGGRLVAGIVYGSDHVEEIYAGSARVKLRAVVVVSSLSGEGSK